MQLGFVLILRGAFSFPFLTQIMVFDVFLDSSPSEDSKFCVSSIRLMFHQVGLFRCHMSVSPLSAFTAVELRRALSPKKSFVLN